ILDALDEAERERGRPAVILADTIKGWGLPSAADPLNHTMVTSPAQIAELRDAFGVAPGEEWAGFDPASAEAAYVRGLPPLWTAPRRAAAPSVPTNLDETYEGAMSTQEAFGRVLSALGRRPDGDAILTAAAVGGPPVARGRRASVGDHALDRRRAARHRLFRTGLRA